MRVLFIYPNLYTQMGFNHGLASLSACLKRAGHAPRLLNLNENLPPVPSRADMLALVRDWLAWFSRPEGTRKGKGRTR